MLDLFHYDPFAEDPPVPPVQRIPSGPLKRQPTVTNPGHPIHIHPPEKARRGDLSRMSRVAKLMAGNREAYDRFDQTAAVLEYDQGMPRQEAEYEAMRRVLENYDETSGSFSAP